MEQLLLFDLKPKIHRAIENFKIYEELALKIHPNGYYLAFSGGKDSQAIYHLAQMAGVKFEPHYHITTVDPPELVQFIKKTYPNVVREQPVLSMWKLIVKKQFPPSRKIRYCCSELKEHGGEGRFTVTGVRWAESKKRQAWNLAQVQTSTQVSPILLNNDNDDRRRPLEHCITRGKYVLNPIIDWTEEEVWGFIHQQIQTYCELYDCGFSRIGCIGCPLASLRQRKWELNRYPKYRMAYLRAFERMLKERTPRDQPSEEAWTCAEEVYNWWLFGSGKKETQVIGQMVFYSGTDGGKTMKEESGNEPKMPQKPENEQLVDGNIYEERDSRYQMLSHKWHAVKLHGEPGRMWPDGVTLNKLRQEMLEVRQSLLTSGITIDAELPPEVSESYMADSTRIRAQSKKAFERYLMLMDYQYLLQQMPKLVKMKKLWLQVAETLGKIQRLEEALKRDDLVILREYGTSGLYDRLLAETAQQVRKQITLNVPKEEKKRKEEDQQMNGQITLSMLVS